VRARVKRAQDNLRTLDGIIQQYEDKLRTVPEAELGLAQLTRESQVYGALYSNLLMRQQQTAIVKASTVSRNRVLDPARVDYKEESPRLPLRLLSGIGGLLLGAAVVVLGRLLSSNFASEAEVQSSLSPLPVLASVPKRRQRWARGRRKLVEGPFELLGGDVNFEFVEAFRALRARLYQTALTPEGGEVLLVTSPSRGDGKTTVVRSLASVLAADRKSVLVIDVDLRQERPAAARAPREADLRAALIGHCEFIDATERVGIAGGEYDYLGPDGAAPVELLAGARMIEFLAEAREQWDFVLIDAPTFPLVSDALSLAPAVDAVLTVIRLEATPARLAVEHVRRLAAVARGHALVVNDPGNQRPRGEGYPAGPRPIRRWWPEWAAAEPDATGHGPVRRLVVPLVGIALLAGAGITASWSVSRKRADGAGNSGIASSVEMLAPAAAHLGAVDTSEPATGAPLPSAGVASGAARPAAEAPSAAEAPPPPVGGSTPSAAALPVAAPAGGATGAAASASAAPGPVAPGGASTPAAGLRRQPASSPPPALTSVPVRAPARAEPESSRPAEAAPSTLATPPAFPVAPGSSSELLSPPSGAAASPASVPAILGAAPPAAVPGPEIR
jgi:Mrp family chromosome partitioning ATPase